MEKFSYSKLNLYDSCAFRYKLTYIDKHFINDDNIANNLGTLTHYIEESIAREIIKNNGEPIFGIDYDYFVDLFINADLKVAKEGSKQTEEVLGVNKLKEKYGDKFYEKDKNNRSPASKCETYANETIYRLSEFLAANRDIELVSVEQPFNITYRGYTFYGFIDRIFRNKATGQIIIEDIKTYSAPVDDKYLKTPLQFVFYTLAARELYQTDDIVCYYDLPFCGIKQQAGSKNYMTRGLKKIDAMLDAIAANEFKPNPSPLCHWCPFSNTYPDQPEEAKKLCPYYCKWTQTNRKVETDYEWMGMENHQAILEDFIKNLDKQKPNRIITLPQIELFNKNERMFFIRK